MIVAVDLPKAVAMAVSLAAGQRGQTPSHWIADRLADFFGERPRPAASRVPLLPTDNDDDLSHDDL